jgi:hypothetical protein
LGDFGRTILLCGEHGFLTNVDLRRSSKIELGVVVRELETVGHIAPIHKDVLHQPETDQVMFSGSYGACCKCQVVVDTSRPNIKISVTTLEVDHLASSPLSPAE